MGSITRLDRCSRFMAEFAQDLITRSIYKVGQTFTLKKVYLEQDPNEEVRVFLLLQDEKGETFPVHDDAWSLFDPEYCSEFEEYEERLAEELGQPLETIRQRLIKADLD